MTKQMMIDKIYDTIPYYNETLYRCNRVWDTWNYGTMTRDDFEEVKPSIMLGDVLDRHDKLPHAEVYTNNSLVIVKAWKDKRNPIEEQPDTLIEYIFNLIS